MPIIGDQRQGQGTNPANVQVGTILPYTGDVPPTGYLLCDGSAISRTLYSQLNALFAGVLVPGPYPYGAGDGSTTFNIPDLRGRSVMGAGSGPGLTARVLASTLGEENHALTALENGTHTHVQDAHTHIQDAHTHLQSSHTHLQSAHSHLQDPHNHTQNSHGHSITDPGHTHTQVAHTHLQDAHTHVERGAGGLSGANVQAVGTNAGNGTEISLNTLTASTTATNQNATAVNNPATVGFTTTNSTTATNNSNTATNQDSTAVNQSTTAVNQNATATNQNATATNQNSGNGDGHNTIHPVLVLNYIIKF